MRTIVCFSLAWMLLLTTATCDPAQVDKAKKDAAAKARQARDATTQKAEQVKEAVEPYVRQVYARATGLDPALSHCPHRMPPRQS